MLLNELIPAAHVLAVLLPLAMLLSGPKVAPWLFLLFAGTLGVATLQPSDPLLVLYGLSAVAAGICVFHPLTLGASPSHAQEH